MPPSREAGSNNRSSQTVAVGDSIMAPLRLSVGGEGAVTSSTIARNEADVLGPIIFVFAGAMLRKARRDERPLRILSFNSCSGTHRTRTRLVSRLPRIIKAGPDHSYGSRNVSRRSDLAPAVSSPVEALLKRLDPSKGTRT